MAELGFHYTLGSGWLEATTTWVGREGCTLGLRGLCNGKYTMSRTRAQATMALDPPLLIELGQDYDSHVTSMTTRVDPVSLSDLYAHLIPFDLRNEHNNSMRVPSLGNNMTQSQPKQKNQAFSTLKNGGHDDGGGHVRGQSWRPNSNNNGWPTCQVCGKQRHDA